MMADFVWNNKESRRILKQKYFPSTDVFQAVAESGCSFTWSSIISARDLLLAGLRWQVGNGHSVKIWTDKWVPRPWTFKVLTAQNTLGWDAMVSEILSEEGEWNEELMRTVFQPEDIGAINVSLSVGALLTNYAGTLRNTVGTRLRVHIAYSVLGLFQTHCLAPLDRLPQALRAGVSFGVLPSLRGSDFLLGGLAGIPFLPPLIWHDGK
ncbi:UNVERIFIED_CONTAM: hypothetical protein Sradi_3819100 [Sesamum radiatum]|uniref:Uncharacterized protein n=1 Tax=Sesamum radiatum TaxID=300843 RepID=A0AAW2Q0J9_SESRA